MSEDREYKNPVAKYVHEYMYWKNIHMRDGCLPTVNYKEYFTILMGLDKDWYSGKAILDVGCGPCGSLEWADNALKRVGLDPLAEAYEFLIQGQHEMEYTPDFAESISFDDGTFDVVTSINSLDHVDNLEGVINEMKRVVKPGGHILIATEIAKFKKFCEPSLVGWNLSEMFADSFDIIEETHCVFIDSGVMESLRNPEPFNHDSPQAESGVLRLILRKKQ